MARAAQSNNYTLNLAVIVIMMTISTVLGAEEAEAPSPSMVTGSAYMAAVPFLAPALVSLMAFFACFSH